MNISDRIYVLDFGSLIAQGLPAEIQKNQHVIDAIWGGKMSEPISAPESAGELLWRH